MSILVITDEVQVDLVGHPIEVFATPEDELGIREISIAADTSHLGATGHALKIRGTREQFEQLAAYVEREQLV